MIDIAANLERARAESAVRKVVEKRLVRAKRIIEAASVMAVREVGLFATEELLFNEAHNVRDHRQNADLLNSLRKPDKSE